MIICILLFHSHYADLAIDISRHHHALPTHQPSVLYSSIKPVKLIKVYVY